MKSLESYFAEVTDNRRRAGMRYPIEKLLIAIVLGIMSNHFGYRELARFMKHNLAELQQYFGWTRSSTPSYETIRNALSQLDIQSVSKAFEEWVSAQSNLTAGDWVALDGKALRSTLNDYNSDMQNFIRIVSAFSHRQGIVLAHEAMENKTQDEGQVLREVVNRLGTQGLILTMDALHCQKNSGNDKKGGPSLCGGSERELQ